jgi:hypothetical protein
LGFTLEQIIPAFVAIISGEASTVEDSKESRNVAVSPLSIDRLLDWMFMCMHLQTKDLPKLFTDTDNDPLDGRDKKLLKWEI